MANLAYHHLSLFQMKWRPICGCLALLMQTNPWDCMQGSREWVKSKFLCQDVDVISLPDKCVVVRCFVSGDYDKILMETGKFSDNIRVTENGRLSCVDRVLKSSNSTFHNVGDRLDPLRNSFNFDVFFLCPSSHILFIRFHDYSKVLVPWIWDKVPCILALAQEISQCYIMYYI